jgi:hypothetical protein
MLRRPRADDRSNRNKGRDCACGAKVSKVSVDDAPTLWTYPLAFAGFRVGQEIMLWAPSEESALIVSGQVTRVGGEQLTLTLHMPLRSADLVLPETVVGVEHPFGFYECASIATRTITDSIEVTLAPCPAEARVEELVPPPKVIQGDRARGGKQRATLRVALATPLSAVVTGVTTKRAVRLAVQIYDVSVGGAQIASSRPLPEGFTFTLHVASTEGEALLTLPFRVAWRRDDGTQCVAGVQFLAHSQAERTVLESFVFDLRWRNTGVTAL